MQQRHPACASPFASAVMSICVKTVQLCTKLERSLPLSVIRVMHWPSAVPSKNVSSRVTVHCTGPVGSHCKTRDRHARDVCTHERALPQLIPQT